MKKVNISFNVTPSNCTTLVDLSITQLENDIPQEEVAAQAVQEEEKPSSDSLRLAEPPAIYQEEVPTYGYTAESGASDTAGALPDNRY